ncbi:hypothetical protein NEOLEDRAFT_1061415, partial [Neolentinus lepideus HHB14362 ss-1]
GQPIEEGDRVKTRFRSGKREGVVQKIVTSEPQDTSDLPVDVKHPPKVLVSHGHMASHNPGTLTLTES